jgi:hypothetical protein
LVHCSGGERAGFDPETPSSPDAGDTSSSGTGSPGGGFGETEGPPGGSGDTTCTEDIDVVLVLDVSSSMNFVLTKLESEIEKVVTASNALKQGAHFGLVFFADNAAMSTTGDKEGGKVHTTAATLEAAFAYARKTFTEPDRNPGDGPSGPTKQNPICEENALDALHMAATEFPWRPNAARVVIVATDDTFIEAPDNYGDRDNPPDGKTDKTSFPREGDYPAKYTLDETIAALKKSEVRVFSFSRLKPPGLFEGGCSTGRRHVTASGQAIAESITYGWSKPYKSKPPIPDQTGGKNFDLAAVRRGSLSLATTINEVVLESHCAGPPK